MASDLGFGNCPRRPPAHSKLGRRLCLLRSGTARKIASSIVLSRDGILLPLRGRCGVLRERSPRADNTTEQETLSTRSRTDGRIQLSATLQSSRPYTSGGDDHPDLVYHDQHTLADAVSHSFAGPHRTPYMHSYHAIAKG